MGSAVLTAQSPRSLNKSPSPRLQEPSSNLEEKALPASPTTLFIKRNRPSNKMTTVHSFGVGPIDCHAWSGDRKQLALSRNSKEVVLYKSGGKGWEADGSLDQHDLRVTGIDWAPKTNRIVTCSADRNAYVWVKQDDGTWKHT